MSWSGTAEAILSNYDEVLKDVYLPAVQDYMNNSNPLAQMIEVNEEDISGRKAKIETHYGRSGAIGSRADAGTLPDASYQKYKQCEVKMKYHYARVGFTGPTIAATRDERGAYARVIDTEMRGITDDFAKDMNRQFWGCGYGVVARWRTTASGTSYTLQKKYMSNTAGGDGFGSTFGAKYLVDAGGQVGQAINRAVPVVLTVASVSGSSVITVATVDATDIAPSAVTLGDGYDTITCTDPSVTEAAGTFYVRPANLVTMNSSTTAGEQRMECVGLRGIVTNEDLDEIALYNGTQSGLNSPNDPLQGLAVATYPWFVAQVASHPSGRYGGQRPLSLPLIQMMFDRVERASNGRGPQLMMTTHAIREELLELYRIDRRTINTMALDGGWTALDYNGVPLMVDPDAIDGEIYFLTLDDIQLYRMSDYDWMQKDGSILSRISNVDAYEATLFRYHELGTRKRHTSGVLTDIDYTERWFG